MPARRNTPRRARSNSVASNASDHSTTNTGTPSRSKVAAAASSRAAKAVADAVSSSVTRPTLPTRTNPLLPNEDPVVKLQVIRREGNNIIIGRVKLPTTNGQDHAFLLKRFDTDAIAASSMFRLAYPWASNEEEKKEMAYLESRFDCERANGGVIDPSKTSATSGPAAILNSKRKPGRKSKAEKAKEQAEAEKAEKGEVDEEEEEDKKEEQAGTLPEGSTGVKLQGTWLPSADAYEIAQQYGLIRYVQPLIEARASSRSDGSGAVLTPVNGSGDHSDSIASASGRKRARKAATGEEGSASPSVTRTRVSRVSHPDGRTETRVDSTETSVSALSPAQIEAEVAQAKALAQRVQGSSVGSSRSRKRRATNERHNADGDDVEADDANVNAVLRTFRHTARAARRRPVATSAGALTAASAVGAGVLAWAAGGNVDTAIQIVQQGFAQLSSFF